MWNPPPVLFLQSQTPPLRIFFDYLAYHEPTDTYPIDTHLGRLHPTDHVFLFLTWHRLGFDEERLRQYRCCPCQVILCANTPGEHRELQAAGVRSIYFNHNATLDERMLTIAESAGGSDCRPYRLLVNAAFKPYKRLHLASGVRDAAWIGYWQPGAAAPEAPPFGTWLNLQPGGSDGGAVQSAANGGSSGGSVNGSRSGGGCTASCYRYLQPAEVAAALNRSMLGGVFSAEEGTCWASTEYLLCGLPVVSTACCGGREVWHNERNSLVVEPTQEAVEEAVERGIALLASGAFDRRQIQEGTLQLMRRFRATLLGEVQRICSQHGVAVNAEQHFTRSFVHKMGLR